MVFKNGEENNKRGNFNNSFTLLIAPVLVTPWPDTYQPVRYQGKKYVYLFKTCIL